MSNHNIIVHFIVKILVLIILVFLDVIKEIIKLGLLQLLIYSEKKLI